MKIPLSLGPSPLSGQLYRETFHLRALIERIEGLPSVIIEYLAQEFLEIVAYTTVWSSLTPFI